MCKGVKTSIGFFLFFVDQFLLRSTEANILFWQDKQLWIFSHNFLGGFEQYGHQLLLFVINLGWDLNSWPQSQSNKYSLWDVLKTIFGSILFLSDQLFAL